VARDERGQDLVVDDGVGAVEEGGEGRLHGAGAVPPAIGVAGEGAVDDGGERLGDAGVALGERGQWLRADLLERGEAVAVAEHELVGEELVEDDAERVDVAALVERAAAGLLGRHVRDLALNGQAWRAVAVGQARRAVAVGQARRAVAVGQARRAVTNGEVGVVARVRGAVDVAGAGSGAGDAEVEDLHGARVAQHDVVRADVAVHDAEGAAEFVAAGVGVGEAGRDLVGDVRGDDDGDALAVAADGVDQAHEVLALDELHRQVEAAVDLAEVEDLDDVGVVEAEGDLRLVDEHPRELGLVGELLADLLDDDALDQALGDRDVGEVDLGHAALADPLGEGVAAERVRQGEAHGGRRIPAKSGGPRPAAAPNVCVRSDRDGIPGILAA
jgi:hypothetical protein